MVRRCTYPSIHVFRLKITVGYLTSTYPTIRTKTCTRVGLLGPRGKHAGNTRETRGKHAGNTRETRGLWARPPVLTPMVHTGNTRAARADACASVPHPCLFEFTSLRHSGHCAEITLCQHFLTPSRKNKNKKETFLSLSGTLGRTHRTKTHGAPASCRPPGTRTGRR